MKRISIIKDHIVGNREVPVKTLETSAQDKKKQEINEFLQTYEKIVDDLIKELSTRYEQPSYAVDWIKKLLDYTIVGGKLNRGLTAVHTLEILKGRPLTQDEKFRSGVLGWGVEWMQSYFLISDDLMDSSITRRGRPCYYLSQHPLGDQGKKVGLIAVNDSFIVKSHIYRMLYFYFRNETYYADLLDLYNETIYQTELGQLLDLTSQPPGRLDFDLYTMDRYLKIVTYKTAFYSFYLPVVSSALLHYGKYDKERFEEARSILIPMGQFFQIQDDYLDCYGSPEVIGKVGRDIEEAKCGWLVVQALKRVNPKQLELLKANYGKDDPNSVSIVKKVYNEIDLVTVYKDYEESSYKELVALINKAQHLPKEVYLRLLQKIYKRNV